MNPEFILGQINKMLSTEELTDRQVEIYLAGLTGYSYTIAQSSQRKWGDANSKIDEGNFYQITPDVEDDGFFDWYCEVRPYNQFFKTVENALIHFAFYRNLWEKTEK
ncbi:hypothetical protein [Spirosoma koreense]